MSRVTALAARGRRAQAKIRPDTCTVTPFGGSASSQACGFIDPRRAPEQPLGRAEAQLTVRGQVAFNLPTTAPDLPLGSTIVYGGRTWAVVDPGPPVHGRMLSRYVGCDEVIG